MATVAKAKHREARALYLEHLDLHPGRTVGNDLDPLEAGIVGDPDHDGGYHISRQDNDADDYSVDESIRDRRGRSDTASAMDIGYFEVRTSRGTFDLYDYNRWLVGLCNAGDPDTADLREVIYSLDGRTVKRWDRLGKRSTGGSSHRTHTHLSEHRDASGQRMVNLARRWLQHIGLLAGEDDDMTEAEIQRALHNTKIGNTGVTFAQVLDPLRFAPAKLDAILTAVLGDADAERISAEIRDQGEQTRAALLAKLTELAPTLAREVADRLGPEAAAGEIGEALARELADMLTAAPAQQG